MKNYVGNKYGKLFVVKEVEKQKNNRMFLCKCDCGKEKVIRGTHLTSGKIKSCGCIQKKDLVGQKYGKLTVVKMVDNENGKGYKWECLCECGKKTLVPTGSLISGNTKSCGNHKKGKSTHGMSKTRLYYIHKHMINRCTNSNYSNYKDYGGRGISVCDEWLDKEKGFEAFMVWSLKNGYDNSLTLDRIDVNGNYVPDNCRWTDTKTQARNQRVRCTNRSGVTGVTVSNEKSRKNKYRATFQLGDKRVVIGSYKTLEEAIEARKQAELKYWGYTKIC